MTLVVLSQSKMLMKPKQLMTAKLFVVSWKDCKKIYKHLLKPTMLCAGSFGTDTCTVSHVQTYYVVCRLFCHCKSCTSVLWCALVLWTHTLAVYISHVQEYYFVCWLLWHRHLQCKSCF